MDVINLISRPQAIDTSLAICAQLSEEFPKTTVHTIYKFTGSTEIDRLDDLFKISEQISDKIYILDMSFGTPNVIDFHESRGISYTDLTTSFMFRLPEISPIKYFKRQVLKNSGRISRLKDDLNSPTHLIKSHHDTDIAARMFVNAVHETGGKVGVIFNGDYPPGENIPVRYLHDSGSSPELADAFLIFSDTHRQQVREFGYTNTATIGYPKAFPGWIDIVNKTTANSKKDDQFVILILTRGEHGSPPHIMSIETLDRILSDIFEQTMKLSDEKSPYFFLKPHPNQNELVLRKIIERNGVCDISTISHSHPSVLSSIADIAITTFSGTAVDALIFDTPTIEYYIPNDAFYETYPNGSPFTKMGVLSAHDSESFIESFYEATNKEYQPPDIGEIYPDTDLSFFES